MHDTGSTWHQKRFPASIIVHATITNKQKRIYDFLMGSRNSSMFAVTAFNRQRVIVKVDADDAGEKKREREWEKKNTMHLKCTWMHDGCMRAPNMSIARGTSSKCVSNCERARVRLPNLCINKYCLVNICVMPLQVFNYTNFDCIQTISNLMRLSVPIHFFFLSTVCTELWRIHTCTFARTVPILLTALF